MTYYFNMFFVRLTILSRIMEGSTENSKNVPKKSTSLGRIMGFRQYTVRLRWERKSLQLACIKFSNFMPILDTSIVTTSTFITSGWGKDFRQMCLYPLVLARVINAIYIISPGSPFTTQVHTSLNVARPYLAMSRGFTTRVLKAMFVCCLELTLTNKRLYRAEASQGAG